MTSSTDPLLEVGRIVKPHGLRGEVVVDMLTNRPERRLTPGTVLSSTAGDLEVVSSRPHQGRWLVFFTGIGDRNAAEGLRSTTLSAPAIDDEDDDVLWVHELVGAEVVDTAGCSHGRIESVEASPASDLLVLPGGILVPLVFVTDRHPDGTVVVDPPAGLFEE